jgi:hypothetical protein
MKILLATAASLLLGGAGYGSLIAWPQGHVVNLTKRIENGNVFLSYVVDVPEQGMRLTNIGDTSEKKAFALVDNGGLWSVDFFLSGTMVSVGPSDCNFNLMHTQTSSSFVVTWKNCVYKQKCKPRRTSPNI